jgi:hypothetical protein
MVKELHFDRLTVRSRSANGSSGPGIVIAVAPSSQEWLAARLELLDGEKALTRRSDELARQRQQLLGSGSNSRPRPLKEPGCRFAGSFATCLPPRRVGRRHRRRGASHVPQMGDGVYGAAVRLVALAGDAVAVQNCPGLRR